MLVVATFVGGITGVISGLLLAPHHGKKTREQLKESYVEDVKKKVTSTIGKGKKKLKKKKEKPLKE